MAGEMPETGALTETGAPGATDDLSWLDTPDEEADGEDGAGDDDGARDGDQDDASSLSLFDGDEGRLLPEQRRALITVLKARYISPSTHPDEWRTLLADAPLIRSRLNDLMLDLHLDPMHQIAYKRQAVADDPVRLPRLLHDSAYSREETILLVYLRQRYRADRSAGADQVIGDRDELHAHVDGFRPPSATDRSMDARRTDLAIESLLKARILLRTADAERLEIAPVIEVLLPMAKLGELLDWLVGENASDPAVTEPHRDQYPSATGQELP